MSAPLSWIEKRETAQSHADGYPIVVDERKWDWRRILSQGHVWIPADGRVLLLANIDTDHLEAILPFAIRHARWLYRWPEACPLIAAVRLELSTRTDRRDA